MSRTADLGARGLPGPRHDTAAPPPGHSTVVQRFLRCAEQAPQRVAMELGDRHLTYGELRARVESLLPWIPAIPRRAAVVAIHALPGPGLMVALMAVMRAGAVALPIDAGLPALRKRQMLELSGARCVIDAAGIPPEALGERHVLRIDPDSGVVLDGALDAEGEGLPRETYPDAAYLFMTSGTTGTPKMVLGRASSLDHFVGWQRDRFAVGPGDRIAQFTSPSFDPCLREIFVTLTSGASLHIPEAAARVSAERMLAFIAASRPTLAHVVPTLARHWLRTLPAVPDALASLRLTLFAGEPLVRNLVLEWQGAAPASVVVNLYGPTETTLARFCWQIPAGDVLATLRDPLPVGWPIPDTAGLVLDAQGRELAPGEIGEVFIDTAFPSYGYLDEGANREKFVQLEGRRPRHGAAFFRTGDLGYTTAQGELVIVGRADKQLKIAGTRINPLEVAEALRTHPGVREAVVGPVTDTRGLRLVAWYVPTGGDVDAPLLREYLRQRLVPAMIPAQLVATDQLPVTSNGKVDMAALHAQLQAPAAQVTRLPTTPLERVVCEAWARTFGVAQVSLDQDFYAFGGDSLKGAEIASQVAREANVELDVQVVFEHPTPQLLVSAIEAGAFAVRAPRPARRRPSDEPGAYPLSPRQRAYRAVCMAERDESWCTLSRIVAPLQRLDEAALVRAVETLVARHDALRMQFPGLWSKDELELLPTAACDPRRVPLQVVDLRAHRYEESHELAMQLRAEGSRALFDVGAWPLFKLALLQLADCSALIVWVHHLIADGPSLNTLVEELVALLEGPADLSRDAAEGAGYLEYIERCRAHEPSALAADRAYWAGLLEGVVPTSLPEARGRAGAAQGMLFTRRFPDGLVAAVQAAAGRLGCTPFVLLLGAFLKVAAQRIGRDDLAVIIPVQVRLDALFERTVGLFFSQMVVRLDTARIGREEGWIRDLAAQVRDGQRHPAYELDQRLADLGIEHRQHDYPLSTLMFNQNHVSASRSYAGATPFGHHALGRDLRFQLQGEVQTHGDDFLISYLYRAGVFSTGEIEQFAAEVIEMTSAIAGHRGGEP